MNLLAWRLTRSLAPLIFPRSIIETTFFPPTVDLTPEETAFFKARGYLVKREVIEPTLLKRALYLSWSQLPKELSPGSATKFTGLVSDSLCTRGVKSRKGRTKFRECVRGEKWLHAMIDQNPCIRGTVEALIGSHRTPRLPYVRGIYPVIPCKAPGFKRPRPHTDGHLFLVGTMTYLSDVLPCGGGFHVWPGSHLVMRNHFETAMGSGWKSTYHQALYTYACRNAAVEIAAPKGSVIFWHHRLAHAAGINRNNDIRHALLADYPSTDAEALAIAPVSRSAWEDWRFEAKAPDESESQVANQAVGRHGPFQRTDLQCNRGCA